MHTTQAVLARWERAELRHDEFKETEFQARVAADIRREAYWNECTPK
ncbi:MAG: hypothetical protein KatS3mg109_0232 [Pirellulaceae bacterium]|nr:MAG: hypothetical protein KatS3mg109_0232 [Pirellulaceae bacterium]GIW96485.1 MAG: hypothetical protein KatS3mg110_4526 [Pirellulaceae bacterium]